MSDDIQPEQEPIQGNHDIPPSQEAEPVAPTPPAQEAFGSFPEQPEVVVVQSAYENPAYYNNPASFNTPPVYGTPPPVGTPPVYGTPPPYGYAIPPLGGYGQPPHGVPFPPATPLPLGTALRQLPRQYWRIFTHPKAATFIEEEGKAAWNIIWLQLLFLGIIEAVVVLVVIFLEFFLFQALLPASSMSTFSQATPIVAIIVVLLLLVFVPISFFFGAGLYHLIAKAFGGRGNFLTYCYNYSLIVIPISILSGVLSIIPCLGSMAGFAGAVYEVILLIFMTMGTHRLSGGKASAAILIPVITGVVLFIAAYVVYLVVIFSMMPHY